ncbi:hypothetical protein M758_4G263500 [Ceratodon purpureus]|nr:hypothetical protein M758_4G263500 [Ceratodon purpureus]
MAFVPPDLRTATCRHPRSMYRRPRPFCEYSPNGVKAAPPSRFRHALLYPQHSCMNVTQPYPSLLPTSLSHLSACLPSSAGPDASQPPAVRQPLIDRPSAPASPD